MMRLGDILRKNKKVGVELETLAEAMGQLARIGQELMRPEEERDPAWRSIPVAKEITVSKGIAQRAPWENIQVTLSDRFSFEIFEGTLCETFFSGWNRDFGILGIH